MSIPEMLKELSKLVNPQHIEYNEDKATALARDIWTKFDKDDI